MTATAIQTGHHPHVFAAAAAAAVAVTAVAAIGVAAADLFASDSGSKGSSVVAPDQLRPGLAPQIGSADALERRAGATATSPYRIGTPDALERSAVVMQPHLVGSPDALERRGGR